MSVLPKALPTVVSPRLSVRTAARFLRLPAVEQMKILHDQKYPKQAPQVFRTPFYHPALSSCRELLTHGRERITDVRAAIQRISQPVRRMHVMRVVETFYASEHMARDLRPATQRRLYAEVEGLQLRLAPDLYAFEGDEERFIYFNFKAEQYDPESAKMTIEIAHWLLEQNGLKVAPRQIEFIDLFTGILYRTNARRSRTIKLLEANARLVESMWPHIEP